MKTSLQRLRALISTVNTIHVVPDESLYTILNIIYNSLSLAFSNLHLAPTKICRQQAETVCCITRFSLDLANYIIVISVNPLALLGSDDPDHPNSPQASFAQQSVGPSTIMTPNCTVRDSSCRVTDTSLLVSVPFSSTNYIDFERLCTSGPASRRAIQSFASPVPLATESVAPYQQLVAKTPSPSMTVSTRGTANYRHVNIEQ
jgi:hypothetical protein